LWDRFLQEIFNEQEQFLEILIKRMLYAIGESKLSQRADDRNAEACCFWLEHIVDPKGWTTSITPSERQLIQAHIVMWCCTHPGHWAQYLGTSMIRLGGKGFGTVWSEILQSGQVPDTDVESQSMLPAGLAGLDGASPDGSSAMQDHMEIDDEQSSIISPKHHQAAGKMRASWTRQVMRPVGEIGAIGN
jgi:ribosomal biogenesis protein LAS1